MVNSRPSVFLFAGNDSYSKEQAIRKLRHSLLDSSSLELDYKVFDGLDAEVHDILGYVSTIPFLASKRLVVINILKNSQKKIQPALLTISKILRNPRVWSWTPKTILFLRKIRNFHAI